MCIPAIGIAASVLGSVVAAYGQIQAGKAANQAAEYNAQVSGIMAKDALSRGDAAEEKARRDQAQLAGEQRASLAARGLNLNVGSPLAVQRDTAMLGDLDAETIRTDARREATGYLNQQVLQKAEGANALRSSYIGAFGTVLGGVRQVADRWYTSRQSSAFA